VARRHTNQGIW